MKVESHWVTDESIRPGDLLVMGAPERVDPSNLFVLSRGETFAVTASGRAGWKIHGVVVGLYRSHLSTGRRYLSSRM